MMDSKNYISRLNEYRQKNYCTLHYEEGVTSGPDHNRTFTLRAIVDGRVYPDGQGNTKKEAKLQAAKNALELLQAGHQPSTDATADVNYNHASTQSGGESDREVSDLSRRTTELSASANSSSTPTNYKGIVSHYCQKKGRCPSYVQVQITGPPHMRRFFYRVMIDGKDYPVGEGTTAKKAQQDAARLAWDALQEQSDWDSKVSVRSSNSNDGDPPTFSSQPMTEDLSESSSQSASVSTSDSVVFIDSSNASMSQMPSRSDVSEDDAPSQMSLSSSQESSSQNMTTDTSSSGQATGSWTSSNDQAVENKTMGSTLNEISVQPRFTSDYDDLKHLGCGAFGCVHKARDKLVDEYFAVKIACYEENCLREVKTLSKLLHNNIIRYYDCWVENSGCPLKHNKSFGKFLYIKMELCDQKTLRKWIDEKNNEPLTDAQRREESLAIAHQIASGVEYIHAQKHIHRDLKPDNILFRGNTVKIGDFGLVTINDASLERTVNTGTPTYMAPEQENQRSYNHKVDIFALGLIYLELFWKLSFGHERGNTLLSAKRSRMFPKEFARTLPEEKETIKSMLCAKPEGRPDASEVKGQLEKLDRILEARKMQRRNITI